MKFNAHHFYGLAFIGLGAAMANINSLKGVVSDHTFGLLTMGLGVGVAVFGYLKSDGNGPQQGS